MRPRSLAPRWLVALVLVGCTGSRARVRVDELSAAAHRQEAARQRAMAEQDYEQFRPTTTAALGAGSWSGDSPRLFPLDVTRFDPGGRALEAAEQHLLHARAHEAAAQALEASEEAECRAVPEKTRAACPMLRAVESIEDLADGVRLRFRDGEAVDALLAQMRCHLAFARTRAFVDVEPCPLYVRGVRMELAADGRGIEVKGDTAAAVRAIRARSRGQGR
jgi:hypothetical protein